MITDEQKEALEKSLARAKRVRPDCIYTWEGSVEVLKVVFEEYLTPTDSRIVKLRDELDQLRAAVGFELDNLRKVVEGIEGAL